MGKKQKLNITSRTANPMIYNSSVLPIIHSFYIEFNYSHCYIKHFVLALNFKQTPEGKHEHWPPHVKGQILKMINYWDIV